MTPRKPRKNVTGDDWDFEHPVELPPARQRRAVVSVAFNARDFDTVSDAADRSNEKLSEFIRKAAIGRADPQGQIASIALSGFPRAPFATNALLDATFANSWPDFQTETAAVTG